MCIMVASVPGLHHGGGRSLTVVSDLCLDGGLVQYQDPAVSYYLPHSQAFPVQVSEVQGSPGNEAISLHH